MNSLKIFTATGNQQVAKLEDDVNDWLKTLAADIEVKLTQTVLDRVSNNQTGGEDRRLILMVWTGQR
jgi:hypothetical protein